MKKKIFTLFIFAFLLTGCLTACNSPSNISGKFSQDKYELSLDEEINFLEEITLKGIEKEGVSFSLSNDGVIEEQERGEYKAIASGETYIFAKNDNKTIAKAKVFVKYKFSSPKNLQIEGDGTLVWDKSFIIKDGKTSFAKEYKIEYAEYNAEGDLGDKTELSVNENSFTLPKKGAYNISITAIGGEEYDNSTTLTKDVNNGVMGLVENPLLETEQEIGNQLAKFSWTAKEGATYDVWLEGFRLLTNTTDNFFEFDYSRFEGGSVLELLVVSNDAVGTSLSTTSKFSLTKLQAPVLEYAYDGTDGMVAWKGEAGANSYLLKATDFDGESQTIGVVNGAEVREYLNGFDGNMYNVEVMALGQTTEDGFFLNSDATLPKTYAKLEIPQPDIVFAGKTAQVTFEDTHYSQNYKISFGDKSIVYNTQSGFTATLDLSVLSVGKHSIKVVALPNADESSLTGVQEKAYGDATSGNVVNSSEYVFDFFVLDEIVDFSHKLEGTTSIVTLDEVENANTYTLFINGELIENVSVLVENKKVQLSFENLAKITPNGSDYVFTIVATTMDGEVERAIRVEKEKTISILQVVTEGAEQTNGYFAWNSVDGAVEYYYEVYKTDKEYNILDQTPVLSGTTTATMTDPILPLGSYYTIKIYSRTTDESLNLDCDFVDENSYFTQNFIATWTIETPEVEFEDKDGALTLKISAVEFGGLYEIYVDGTLDGSIVVGEEKESYEYVLANTLADAKNYEVQVIAKSGLLYDPVLYLDSNPQTLGIERLSQVTFTMEYAEDIFGRRTHENQNYEVVENSVGVEVSLAGKVISDEGYTLDLLDYAKFGSSFTLKYRYLPAHNNGNQYYLASVKNAVTFERAVSPNAFTYKDGLIFWTDLNTEPALRYEAVLGLVNSKSANYYHTFEIENTEKEYDLQTLVDLLTSTNETFNSAYRQAEYLQIELYAFCDGVLGEVYRLPSPNAVTSSGATKLDVYTLKKPVVTFDEQTNLISWTEESETSIYEIYVDEILAVEGYESAQILLTDLGTYDFLTAKKIQVKATNSTYLDSELSDEILIEQIQLDDSLGISKTADGYVGTVSVLYDQSHVGEVWINGSATNVSYTAGANNATFNFANFADTTEFKIVLKAKNDGSTHYYFDSAPYTVTGENLANKTFTLTVKEGSSLWNDYIENRYSWTNDLRTMYGASTPAVVYILHAIDSVAEYTAEINKFDTWTDGKDLEYDLGVSLCSGDIEVYLSAIVEYDYVLRGANARGFIGKVQSNSVIKEKIENPEVVSYKTVSDTRYDDAFENKHKSGFEFIIKDVWGDIADEELLFQFTWIAKDTGCHETSSALGLVTCYSRRQLNTINPSNIQLIDGYFHIQVTAWTCSGNYHGICDHFFVGENVPNEIFLRVVADRMICSTKQTFKVTRFEDSPMASLDYDGDGLLTIEDTQEGASYMLRAKFGDTILSKEILASELGEDRKVNLMTDDFLNQMEYMGLAMYAIEIIAFDADGAVLPSAGIGIVAGVYTGKFKDIHIDDNGNINFTVAFRGYENLKFSARIKLDDGSYITKDFTAKAIEGSTTQYYITMAEVFDLFADEIQLVDTEYTIEFSIREEGCIHSPWSPLTMGYRNTDNPRLVRGRDLEQDYLLFEVDGGSIETTSFSVRVTGTFMDEVFDDDTGEEGDGTGEDTGDGTEDGTGGEDVPTPDENEVRYDYTEDTRDFYLSPSEILGYWVTDLEGKNGYFAKEKGTEANLIYTQYYVVSIRELLSTIAYGDVTIKIARVGKADTTYYQYNTNKYDLFKLNGVNDGEDEADIISIEDNILRWKWQSTAVSDNVPTAFYVILENTVLGTSSKLLTTAYGIDMRSVGLKENCTYNVSVIALNFNNTIVASNESVKINTMLYPTPISVDVVDGQIVYDHDEFMASDLMKDITDYFAEETPEVNLHTKIGLMGYMSPFAFTVPAFDEAMLQMKIVSVTEGGATNLTYTGTINASVLMPDIDISFASYDYATQENVGTMKESYITLLRMYQSLMLSTKDTVEAENTDKFITSVSRSNHGIGDNVILIDDFARILPEGEYLFSICQVGEANFIESNYSRAIKIYISASPELTLQTEAGEGETYYTATVKPTMNMVDTGSGYTKQLATVYKMQLRYQPIDGLYMIDEIINLIIGYDGSQWHISIGGQDLNTAVAGVITNVASGLAIPSFKLNMNKLKDAMIALGYGDAIKVNTLITVNIFTYSCDDGYVVNGKSGKFNLRYLDLRTDGITFVNGEFTINATLDQSYEILARYKIASQAETSIRQNFENGMVKLNLDKSGVYEYIVLSLNGSISPSTMNVESDSYVIKGLYKLNAPSLTTRNNNINISYNSNDIRYMSTLQFNLANDISLKGAYTGADSGYYYQSELTSTDSVVPYVVGSVNGYDQVLYPSELMAEEFYAYLSGNSGSFSVSEEEVSEGDNLLVFDNIRPVLSSSVSTIEAKMLPSLNSIMLYGGDFYLDDRCVGINMVTDKQFNNMSGNIVFEIIVRYYGIDNTDENGNTLMELHEETVYSERMYASEVQSFAQIVNSGFVSADYDYFTLSITTLGGLRVNSGTANAVQTLEGTYILLSDSVFYGPNSVYTSATYGEHALRSLTITSPIMTRTQTPYLAENSKGITNGAIHFVIDKSLYYYEEGIGGRLRSPLICTEGEEEEEEEEIDKVAQHTANRISIVAKYNYGGSVVTEIVTGTISFATSTELGEENNVYCTVVPSEGLFARAMDTISFYITIYGNNAITSVPLVIDNVYKLPQVTENYYDVELVGEKTFLNFTKYFDSISIANDYSCYKIVIQYMLAGDSNIYKEELTASSPIKRFELYSDATIVAIQAQDAQDGTTLNPKKLLYSDTTNLALNKTSIEGLEVTWNSQEMRFEWAWTDGRTTDYEYYVSLYVSGRQETEIVSTNYYMPHNRGLIASGGFEIRARIKNDGTNKMYSFSDRLVYEGEEISYNLFSGGNGTKTNPYLIANETDFLNIAKRNTIDKKFYFALSDNVSLSTANFNKTVDGIMTPVMPEFYGSLDGSGYKLTITASTVVPLASAFDGSLVGISGLSFTHYSAIFTTISAVAEVRNVYIDYTIAYNGLFDSNILFAPLAMYNYGTIEGVNVTAFTVQNLSGKGENNVFVGGIVGVNYGSIANCTNTATFAYSMAQQLSLNFGYGGICAYNGNITSAYGTITNCFNQGDKQVTVSVNNNLVYLAGITLSNGAKISTSGNDGNMKLNVRGAGVTTFTGYFAGITISSNNGVLEYLYNNGTLENISAYGTLNYGGIAYALSGGTINTLVATVSGQPIVKSCTSKPISLGSNYATDNSGTHALITTLQLSAQSISCPNGYLLEIKTNGEGFKATITKA